MSQVHAVPVTGRAGAGALLAHRRNDDAVGQFEVAQRPGFKKTRHASTIARAKRLDVLNRVRHCTCGHRNKCVDSGDVTAAVRFVGAGQSFSLYYRVPTAPLIDRFAKQMHPLYKHKSNGELEKIAEKEPEKTTAILQTYDAIKSAAGADMNCKK